MSGPDRARGARARLATLAVDRASLTARERVLVALVELGADELEVLAQVADGLVRGRSLYGELELGADQRDMAGEALEEVRDALVYAGAALVRLRRPASHAELAQERRSRPTTGAETPKGATGSSGPDSQGRPEP